MTDDTNKIDNRPGRQMDDNIDDLGRKPDGSTLDQPRTGKTEKSDDPSKRDVEPGSDADSNDRSLGV